MKGLVDGQMTFPREREEHLDLEIQDGPWRRPGKWRSFPRAISGRRRPSMVQCFVHLPDEAVEPVVRRPLCVSCDDRVVVVHESIRFFGEHRADVFGTVLDARDFLPDGAASSTIERRVSASNELLRFSRCSSSAAIEIARVAPFFVPRRAAVSSSSVAVVSRTELARSSPSCPSKLFLAPWSVNILPVSKRRPMDGISSAQFSSPFSSKFQWTRTISPRRIMSPISSWLPSMRKLPTCRLSAGSVTPASI